MKVLINRGYGSLHFSQSGINRCIDLSLPYFTKEQYMAFEEAADENIKLVAACWLNKDKEIRVKDDDDFFPKGSRWDFFVIRQNKKYKTPKDALSDKEKIYKENQKIIRTHPIIIQCFEEMGEKFANKGKIVEIPFETVDGWHISNYDGQEWIAENHNTWR
jgi:hypothetical protein